MQHMLLPPKDDSPDKTVTVDIPDEDSKPRYPYGLEIRLGKECLDKLNRAVKDFEVGQEVMLRAKSTVQTTVEAQSVDGEDVYPANSVELQITHLELKLKDGFEDAWEERARDLD